MDKLINLDSPDLSVQVTLLNLSPSGSNIYQVYQVRDVWHDILTDSFPYGADNPLSNTNAEYLVQMQQLLDLTDDDNLLTGSVTRMQGFFQHVPFFHLHFRGRPDEDEVLCFHDTETQIWGDMEETHRSFIGNMKNNVYGAIAIAQFVQFYRYTPEGKFETFLLQSKQVLHVAIDEEIIVRHLRKVREEWV